jgi:methylated-DNA-protein-cysteine methyltransferase related protein
MPAKNFFELVYQVVAQIPNGRVATYSAVAKFLNNPRGSRAVGWAMRQCPYPNEKVPCHRVIKADGSIGGYGYDGVQRKTALLKKEGIRFSKGRVDLKKYEFRDFNWPG